MDILYECKETDDREKESNDEDRDEVRGVRKKRREIRIITNARAR